MNIGIIGCGYVACYYADTLPNHPHLKILGVTDINQERARRFAEFYHVKMFSTNEELLANKDIQIIINCTNPESHYGVTMQCLEAGKHVYTEKPIATSSRLAKKLVNFAKKKNLYLSSAPCNLLSEYAQGMWKALREGEIGKTRLVYAQLDDGAIHQMQYRTWFSRNGVSWPYKNEFKVGCIYEHATYCLSLLVAFFGSAKEVFAFTSCIIPDKYENCDNSQLGPDFSVACIKFESGVIVKLTCGLVAPNNHSLLIIGDEGVISIEDIFWNFRQNVYIQKKRHSKSNEREDSHIYLEKKEEYCFNMPEDFKYKCDYEENMDYGRGIAELAEAITKKRKCRLSTDLTLHVMEIMEVMQKAQGSKTYKKIKSRCTPIEPMDWAK